MKKEVKKQLPSIKLKFDTKKSLESLKNCVDKFRVTHDDIINFLIEYYKQKNKIK